MELDDIARDISKNNNTEEIIKDYIKSKCIIKSGKAYTKTLKGNASKTEYVISPEDYTTIATNTGLSAYSFDKIKELVDLTFNLLLEEDKSKEDWLDENLNLNVLPIEWDEIVGDKLAWTIEYTKKECMEGPRDVLLVKLDGNCWYPIPYGNMEYSALLRQILVIWKSKGHFKSISDKHQEYTVKQRKLKRKTSTFHMWIVNNLPYFMEDMKYFIRDVLPFTNDPNKNAYYYYDLSSLNPNPSLENCPTYNYFFDVFIQDDGNTEHRDIFLARIGSLIDENARSRQCLWVKSPGGIGKSMLWKVINHHMPGGTSLSSGAISNQFWASQLYNKRYFTYDDCKAVDLISSGKIHPVLSGSGVQVEFKGRDSFYAEVRVAAFVNSNHYPHYTSEISELTRLLLVVANNNRISQMTHIKDGQLVGNEIEHERKLEEEYNEFISVCYKIWKEKIGYGSNIQTSKEYEEWKKSLSGVPEDYENDDYFLRDFEEGKDYKLLASELSAYRNLYNLKQNFIEYMSRKVGKSRVSRDKEGSQYRYYTGVKLKDDIRIKVLGGNRNSITGICKPKKVETVTTTVIENEKTQTISDALNTLL